MYSIRILARLLNLCVSAAQILMLIRAVLSWFTSVPGNKFFDIVYYITDFLIRPVRYFMNKYNLIPRIPIDISFLIAFVLLELVRRVLYIFY